MKHCLSRVFHLVSQTSLYLQEKIEGKVGLIFFKCLIAYPNLRLGTDFLCVCEAWRKRVSEWVDEGGSEMNE